MKLAFSIPVKWNRITKRQSCYYCLLIFLELTWIFLCSRYNFFTSVQFAGLEIHYCVLLSTETSQMNPEPPVVHVEDRFSVQEGPRIQQRVSDSVSEGGSVVITAGVKGLRPHSDWALLLFCALEKGSSLIWDFQTTTRIQSSQGKRTPSFSMVYSWF